MAGLARLSLGSGKRPELIDWLVIDGETPIEGLLGVDYAFRMKCDDEAACCEEEIRLRLRGSAVETRALLQQLEWALRAANDSQVGYCFLRLFSQSLQAYVYSRILKVRLDVAGGHYPSGPLGSFELVINLTRESFFVGDEQKCNLFNTSGYGDSLGLTVYNHDDSHSGHDNWFSVNLSTLNASRAYPLRLAFFVPEGAPVLGDLHVGSLLISEAGSVPSMSIEAENGLGGVTMVDTKASNGKYQRYTWSGSGWAELATWSLSSLMVSKLAGHHILPVLRLHHLPVSEHLRLRLVLKLQTQRLYESPVCVVQNEKSGQVFAPLDFGLASLPRLNFAAGLNLCLEGMQSESSATLDVDDLLLLPQKSYAFYQSLRPLASGSSLIDDAWRGLSWSMNAGQELKTHLCLEEGHFLRPGLEKRFFVFMANESKQSPIDMSLKVMAWYRPVLEIP